MVPSYVQIIPLLLATSLLAAGLSSYLLQPYSAEAPRRVLLSHVHHSGNWTPHHANSPTLSSNSVTTDGTTSIASSSGNTPSGNATTNTGVSSMASVTSRLALGVCDSSPWAPLLLGMQAGPGQQQLLAEPLPLLGPEYTHLFPVSKLVGECVL